MWHLKLYIIIIIIYHIWWCFSSYNIFATWVNESKWNKLHASYKIWLKTVLIPANFITTLFPFYTEITEHLILLHLRTLIYKNYTEQKQQQSNDRLCSLFGVMQNVTTTWCQFYTASNGHQFGSKLFSRLLSCMVMCPWHCSGMSTGVLLSVERVRGHSRVWCTSSGSFQTLSVQLSSMSTGQWSVACCWLTG